MSGTVIGGERAARTNKLRHGQDFYIKTGRLGGQQGHTGGFAANRELARIAGKKGGSAPRRPRIAKRKWWDIKTLLRRHHER